VLGDLEGGLGLVRQLRLGHRTEGEHGGFRPRADLLRAVSGSVQVVAESIVPGDEGALQVLAGVRVIAKLVQLLVALGAQPHVGQQVCRPLQQAVLPEAQLALDAEAGVVGSVHRELLARATRSALAGHGIAVGKAAASLSVPLPNSERSLPSSTPDTNSFVRLAVRPARC